MLALLRTRRWVLFSLAVVVAIAAFGVLSAWQWHRAEGRAAEAAAMAAAGAQAPAVWDASAAAGVGLFAWQPVAITGRYDAREQVLVRNRPQGGRAGFWVLTPLVTDRGVGWVNRGWIPTTSAAAAVVVAPEPPASIVDVIGQWLPGDPDGWVDPGELPVGQVTAVDIGRLSSQADLGPSLPGYVVLTQSDPDQEGVERIVPPAPDSSRNISYAIQWLIFAVIAIVGWGYLLRREHREVLATQAN